MERRDGLTEPHDAVRGALARQRAVPLVHAREDLIARAKEAYKQSLSAPKDARESSLPF